ncbi:MAG: DHHW family protein [Eubacteriales bacterium]
MRGDNPYTVINVPDNPQDRNVLVLKDSFGNALVPYLCEHYGNIFVVDLRYLKENLYDLFKDAGLTDILFVNNVQAANTSAWYRMYLKAVGVES